MRHFSSDEWTEFVRNTLKPKEKELMQAHLESGCKHCADTWATWKRVNETASRERTYEPPPAAVETAKSLMSAYRHIAPQSVAASLLFDSWQATAAAGIRSSGAVARQMLYGFEDYRVDLRLEPKFDTDEVLLVGQVLHPAIEAHGVGTIGVTLMRGGKVLGLAQTNEFGEFELECNLAGRLDLLLTLSGGEIVKIPIIEPFNEEDRLHGAQSADFTGFRKARPRNSRRTRN